jgi:hypothetical protein
MAAAIAAEDRDDFGRAVAAALGHLLLEPLVCGKLMAVKPNETDAGASNTTGVTQPDAFRAVLRELKRFGPRQLVIIGGHPVMLGTGPLGGHAVETGLTRPRA